EDLAGATKEDVSKTLNITEAAAQNLIYEAQAASKSGVTIDKIAGVTLDEATKLAGLVQAAPGQATVGVLLTKSVEDVAKALNPTAPDLARAGALLNGISSGITSQITTSTGARTGTMSGMGGYTGMTGRFP